MAFKNEIRCAGQPSLLQHYHIYQDLIIVVLLFCYREVDPRQSQHVSGRNDSSSPKMYSKWSPQYCFISMGLYYRHLGIIPTTVKPTGASVTPHVAESSSWWNICSSWLYIRANIQVWFEKFEMAWHPFPMFHISGSTLLVKIGFGLAPVYTDTMSIV